MDEIKQNETISGGKTRDESASFPIYDRRKKGIWSVVAERSLANALNRDQRRCDGVLVWKIVIPDVYRQEYRHRMCNTRYYRRRRQMSECRRSSKEPSRHKFLDFEMPAQLLSRNYYGTRCIANRCQSSLVKIYRRDGHF